MTDKPYQIEGDFQMGRIRQHFVMQIVAPSEAAAKDRAFATLGSRHGVERREVTLASCKSIAADAVTDPAARVALRNQK